MQEAFYARLRFYDKIKNLIFIHTIKIVHKTYGYLRIFAQNCSYFFTWSIIVDNFDRYKSIVSDSPFFWIIWVDFGQHLPI